MKDEVIYGRGAEKWKSIKFPPRFNTTEDYQISNYGRVRNYKGNGAYRIKKPILYNGQLLYKFNFPASQNDGIKLQLHQMAKNLVASHFCKDYYKGCYVLWKDYNRLNNYHSNLLCLDPSKGRSHAAYGKGKKTPQVPVIPPETENLKKDKSSPHKVEVEYDFFKPIPGFKNYEINRNGVIRRATPPFKGRIMKQRMHPDKFYFLDLLDNSKKRRTVYTHKAVAQTWNINVLPDKRTIVIHKDGDTLNNFSDNLEWVDHSEALKHQFAMNQRDNRKSWKTRKKKYGKSGKKLKEEYS